MGKVRCHPARGEPARGNLEPPVQGKLQSRRRRGNPESCAEKKALGRGEEKLSSCVAEGKPELRDEKEALSHPAKGKLEPFGLGETPVIW